MATYLVTGAAGFIASKVCELLLASGHNVVGIDNLNDYYDVRLKDYRLSRLLHAPDWTLGIAMTRSRFGNCDQKETGSRLPSPFISDRFSFFHIDIE